MGKSAKAFAEVQGKTFAEAEEYFMPCLVHGRMWQRFGQTGRLDGATHV